MLPFTYGSRTDYERPSFRQIRPFKNCCDYVTDRWWMPCFQLYRIHQKSTHKGWYSDVPVISLSAQGLESNPGFSYDIPMLKKAMMAVEYGDIFMNVVYRTRPYEQFLVQLMHFMKNGRRSALNSLLKIRFI